MRIVKIIGSALWGFGSFLTLGAAGTLESCEQPDEWFSVCSIIVGLVLAWLGWQIVKRTRKWY